jgi:hypothetical protein
MPGFQILPSIHKLNIPDIHSTGMEFLDEENIYIFKANRYDIRRH